MKKISSLILCVVLIFLVSGCGNNDVTTGIKTITCKSEEMGENPTNVYYEKYIVSDNKVAKFEKYSIIGYTDEYLNNVSLDDIKEIYLKSNLYDVSKVSNNELKLVYKEPVNVFENLKSENLVETIVSTMEENEFALYSYTCEVK